METSAVNAIVNKAKSLNLYDKLVIVDDNYHMYSIKSDTQTCYFDDSVKAVVCFSKNNNPIQDTMNEPKFMIEWVDYEHITSIYIKTAVNIPGDVGSFNFIEEDVKNIIRKSGGTYQAAGFLYNKGGEKKPSPVYPELELGVPYEPVKPTSSNEESEDDQP